MNEATRKATKWDHASLAERFWFKVNVGNPTECWKWLAYCDPCGYGKFYVPQQRGMGYASRVAYELTNGPIPKGLYVLHRCDNPPCVNPSHLFLGSKKDNTQDMVRKQRGLVGVKNGQAKLTAAQVTRIRARVAEGARRRDIADEHNVSLTTIDHIVWRETWKHIE